MYFCYVFLGLHHCPHCEGRRAALCSLLLHRPGILIVCLFLIELVIILLVVVGFELVNHIHNTDVIAIVISWLSLAYIATWITMLCRDCGQYELLIAGPSGHAV